MAKATPTNIPTNGEVTPITHQPLGPLHPNGAFAHVTGHNAPLPVPLLEPLGEVERLLGLPVVLLVQSRVGVDPMSMVSEDVYYALLRGRSLLVPGSPVALVVDSPGGLAGSAYRIARFFRKHCGGFVAVVPGVAKSAATLVSLGASQIIMGKFAELGPLDAQTIDPDREKRISALEVTQSLTRLHREAMQMVDAQMQHWVKRSPRSTDYLLPEAAAFVAALMKPVMEKVDAVDFTSKARVLRVAYDYASRLLQDGGMPRFDAERVAGDLTDNYSEHDFVVRVDELERLGVRIGDAEGELAEVLCDLHGLFENFVYESPYSLIGRIVRPQEGDDHEQGQDQANGSEGGDADPSSSAERPTAGRRPSRRGSGIGDRPDSEGQDQ